MLLFYFLFLFIGYAVSAQETTSTLSGSVTDNKGTPVSGASIVLKHEPTGYVSGTSSNSKGLFAIPNLKPGGPYTVTVTFVGFETQKVENINLTLGNNPDGNFTLKTIDKSLQEIVISGNKKSGSGFNISRVTDEYFANYWKKP